MSRLAALVCFACCLVAGLASAQDFNAAAETILPDGVRLGMSVADIKQARPTAFEGPPASLPVGEDSKTHRTLMEVQRMGAPGHLSYWYLCSRERLVGVLRTRNLVGIDADSSKSAAQQTYSQLAQQLGAARQETLLRKGTTAFVPVRADVWRSKEGRAIYFVATDQEMTVAVVEPTDFPLAQVFIRPDPQRFPIEEADKRSVFDLERPIAAASATPAPSASPASVANQRPNAPLRAAEALPASSPAATSTPTPASQQAASWNVNRTLMLVVAGVVIAALAAALIRRRKP